jgi:acid phosphatase type 7
MQGRGFVARRWTTMLGRVATIAACVLVLQQCSRPTGSGPTGPSGGGNQPPTTPTPNPTPPGPQTFVGAGDIALCGGQQEATARLLDGIGGTVFTLGDNAYMSGTAAEFRDCYNPSWGRHRNRTFPSPGNHDYGQINAQAYFDYFGANAGPARLGYYSYNVGGWHILSLNSDATAWNATQQAWIRQDVAANASTKCMLAYWHYPAFSSGPNRKEPQGRDMFRLMYELNVDLVLTGHDHTYERFAPQDPDGRLDPARGIRQFVVGTGGMVPLYEFISVQPNSEAKSDRNSGAGHGVLKLTLNADSYGWEFLTVGRGTFDSGGPAACH